MIINNSIGKVIHTQRNNKLRPYSACNVTSFINALKYLDIDFFYNKLTQPEDYFMKLMMTEKSWNRLYSKYGRGVGANPWNFSDILVDVCNEELVGSPVCEIKNVTAKQIVDHLEEGNVCTTSGAFTKSGHFVCIVGCELDKVKNVVRFIIDDPFGDYHTKYKDWNGDNIDFPIGDFHSLIWPRGKLVKKTQFFYRE